MQAVEEILSLSAKTVERELEKWLSDKYSGNTILADAMRYAVLGGGKRIRAFLVLQFCRLAGGREEAALPFAAAIEMVHAYSLVHDDLPCMDNDDMRRGKPSCHKAFGEANALLAGDTLLTQAFEVIASNTEVSALAALNASRILAQGAGALGMCGGQYYDLSESCASVEELRRLQRMKTGALIRAAVLLGCYAASEDPDPALLRAAEIYADNIGFAFQIVDDILDVISTEEELGKPIGSDAKNDKKTVLSYRSMEEARTLAQTVTDSAVQAVSVFDGSEVLCDLARFLLNRKK